MSIARIKKNDTVIAIAGEYAGQTGKVLAVDVAGDTAIVEGLNVVKRAVRRSQTSPDGGYKEFEAPIRLSNLMPYDPDRKKGVRIARVLEGDRRVRKAKGTGRVLD
ncbi:MAG: 50S ribosomal protein L24 [Kiritimatiellae bacterium]|nr:50S ribosomal protein L24 [Kiritimatiellia bacterium]